MFVFPCLIHLGLFSPVFIKIIVKAILLQDKLNRRVILDKMIGSTCKPMEIKELVERQFHNVGRSLEGLSHVAFIDVFSDSEDPDGLK